MIKITNKEKRGGPFLKEDYNIFQEMDKNGGVVKMKLLKKINGKHTGLFAAGLLLGTAGVKVLSSKDAKNVYTKCTAAVLRAKESVMKTVTTVQENAGDIYAEAQQINEERKAQETSYADESQTEE